MSDLMRALAVATMLLIGNNTAGAVERPREQVHMCLHIPPRYSVANTISRLKGKLAIRIYREYLDQVRNFR